ncbi:hypothetical protein CALVIDRAFT_530156 [Calocera viscosa TUFC12733]|uniref:Small ribosomal subunit protein mS33 n=1 Tax=Calocera viscosa (strain TUFC12733) TaxID=1330018 RepID=A0A167I5R9_CALVF|nr:hypothetical protein CALVIDRAFT_530156 [Calocera viscosa TUFC12733]
MASLKTKLQQLTKLQCALFETSYNPTSARTGAKYLRARLRGPAMVRYYPQRIPIQLVRAVAWDMNIVDSREEQRVDDVVDLKKRGKGAPKKKKEKAEEKGKKGGGKKK